MPTAEPATAIGHDEAARLLEPLVPAKGLALAVSGGADSLALLVLVARWREPHARPVTVLTVDHGLRAESTAEAAKVAEIAENHGLDCRVLTWRPEQTPRSDIEAAARRARYRLLIAAARAAGASHLVLAHHRDDVAEGLLLRLARGAGVFGLAAMRPAINVGGLIISRPLLQVARQRLTATVAAAGLTPIEDPMNEDPRFARARMRRLMPVLAGEGIDATGLAEAAARLASAADALDATVTEFIAKTATVDRLATVRMERTLFAEAPAEVRRRALVRILAAVGGNDYPPRRDRLAGLQEMTAPDAPPPHRRSLAGVVVERRDDAVLFVREPGRAGLPEIGVRDGFTGVWDNRFDLTVTGRVPDGAVVVALGEEGRRTIGWRGGEPMAIAALPALKVDGHVLEVPPLGWSEAGNTCLNANEIVSRRLAAPPLFPAFG